MAAIGDDDQRGGRMEGAGRTARAMRQKEAAPSRRKAPPAERAYDVRVRLRADRAVSTESLAMNAAPHQSEPGPPGLIGVDEHARARCDRW